MPSGVYDLDGIKKLVKPKNWCPYYLICRAINCQVVVVVDHDEDDGDGTCGGAISGNRFIGSNIIVAFCRIIFYYSLLPTQDFHHFS